MEKGVERRDHKRPSRLLVLKERRARLARPLALPRALSKSGTAVEDPCAPSHDSEPHILRRREGLVALIELGRGELAAAVLSYLDIEAAAALRLSCNRVRAAMDAEDVRWSCMRNMHRDTILGRPVDMVGAEDLQAHRRRVLESRPAHNPFLMYVACRRDIERHLRYMVRACLDVQHQLERPASGPRPRLDAKDMPTGSGRRAGAAGGQRGQSARGTRSMDHSLYETLVHAVRLLRCLLVRTLAAAGAMGHAPLARFCIETAVKLAGSTLHAMGLCPNPLHFDPRWIEAYVGGYVCGVDTNAPPAAHRTLSTATSTNQWDRPREGAQPTPGTIGGDDGNVTQWDAVCEDERNGALANTRRSPIGDAVLQRAVRADEALWQAHIADRLYREQVDAVVNAIGMRGRSMVWALGLFTTRLALDASEREEQETGDRLDVLCFAPPNVREYVMQNTPRLDAWCPLAWIASLDTVHESMGHATAALMDATRDALCALVYGATTGDGHRPQHILSAKSHGKGTHAQHKPVTSDRKRSGGACTSAPIDGQLLGILFQANERIGHDHLLGHAMHRALDDLLRNINAKRHTLGDREPEKGRRASRLLWAFDRDAMRLAAHRARAQVGHLDASRLYAWFHPPFAHATHSAGAMESISLVNPYVGSAQQQGYGKIEDDLYAFLSLWQTHGRRHQGGDTLDVLGLYAPINRWTCALDGLLAERRHMCCRMRARLVQAATAYALSVAIPERSPTDAWSAPDASPGGIGVSLLLRSARRAACRCPLAMNALVGAALAHPQARPMLLWRDAIPQRPPVSGMKDALVQTMRDMLVRDTAPEAADRVAGGGALERVLETTHAHLLYWTRVRDAGLLGEAGVAPQEVEIQIEKLRMCRRVALDAAHTTDPDIGNIRLLLLDANVPAAQSLPPFLDTARRMAKDDRKSESAGESSKTKRVYDSTKRTIAHSSCAPSAPSARTGPPKKRPRIEAEDTADDAGTPEDVLAAMVLASLRQKGTRAVSGAIPPHP